GGPWRPTSHAIHSLSSETLLIGCSRISPVLPQTGTGCPCQYSPLHEHRHDDVDVVVIAHGLEHALAGRARCLHGDLAVQRLEDVLQVLRVEGDLDALAFDRRVDLALVVADLVRTG